MTTCANLLAHDQSIGWGSLYFELTSALLAKYTSPHVLEIGVAYGSHAYKMLYSDSIGTYTGLDPYVFSYDNNDPFCADVAKVTGFNDQRCMDSLFHYTSLKLLEAQNAVLHRDNSSRLLLPKNIYDFIFIDGDHTVGAVLKDLCAAQALIKPGGIVAMDDTSWDGVRSAAVTFAKLVDKKILTIRSSKYELWYFQY